MGFGIGGKFNCRCHEMPAFYDDAGMVAYITDGIQLFAAFPSFQPEHKTGICPENHKEVEHATLSAWHQPHEGCWHGGLPVWSYETMLSTKRDVQMVSGIMTSAFEVDP
jgi:hypothetical protein